MADGCCNPLGSASVPAGPTQPFRATFYVDPLFTGIHTGSQQNPFQTAAAAFAAGAAQGLTRGILYLPPGASLVENVVFPTTGEWEIAANPALGSITNVIITGNVDISSTASRRAALTQLQVNGNITGNCSAGTQRILLTACTVTGSVTLTQTGLGINRLATGSVVNEFTGFGFDQNQLVGAVTIAGTFAGSSCIFNTSLSVTQTSSFEDCLMPPTTTLAGAGTIDMWCFGCSNTVGGPLTFVATGGGQLRLRCDGVTLNEWARVSLVPTGNVAIFAANGGRSFVGNQVTNVGVTPILGRLPAGLQVMEACLTLLANGGTATGNAVLNAVYTDATGTLVTEPVTTALNVAGALGSKARGVLPISQDGSAAVSWSVTGITNATGLSYQVAVACRQAS